jgi:hypothetical protein
MSFRGRFRADQSRDQHKCEITIQICAIKSSFLPPGLGPRVPGRLPDLLRELPDMAKWVPDWIVHLSPSWIRFDPSDLSWSRIPTVPKTVDLVVLSAAVMLGEAFSERCGDREGKCFGRHRRFVCLNDLQFPCDFRSREDSTMELDPSLFPQFAGVPDVPTDDLQRHQAASLQTTCGRSVTNLAVILFRSATPRPTPM